MIMKTGYGDIEPFSTKDGSIIRELTRGLKQSLAEAIVPAGKTANLHKHLRSEEFYQNTRWSRRRPNG